MEVKFGGQLQQRSVPDRLRLIIATGGDGLHVVEHEYQRHDAQRVEARHQPARKSVSRRMLSVEITHVQRLYLRE
jgi:hypothetical protein